MVSASVAAPLLALLAAPISHGQTSVNLDGTRGSNWNLANYSTTGGLDLSLGFYAEYLIVGGGGSGGTPGGSGGQGTWGTGGGGGGGLLSGTTQLSSTSYAVAVGAGGTAPSYSEGSTTRGNNGGNSTFGGFTAIGGGGGAGGDNSFGGDGRDGGSGGGGGSKFSNPGGNGTVGQGYAGGTARGGDNSSAGSRTAGGGGGGAGGAGSNAAASSSVAGNGGAGLANSITGIPLLYAGGGGGGARDTHGGQQAGSGGSGGGGAGSTTGSATAGTNGLGGGGGGRGADGVGGNGGNGIVIVRYQGASLGGIGGTVTAGTGSAAGYTLHTYTATGNSSFDMSGVNLNNRLGLSLNGQITGSGALTYSGPGNLTLAGNNSFTGNTRAGSGNLNLNHANALAGSTLDMNSSDSGTVSFGNKSGAYTLGGLQGSRNLSYGNKTLFIGANNQSTTYSGQLTGSGGLAKTGSGTLTLQANSYQGGNVTIAAGKLVVPSLNDKYTFNNGVLEIANSVNLSHGGNIAGSGSLIKSGAGSLTLSGVNTSTGDTTVNAGTLVLATANSIRKDTLITLASGATLTVNEQTYIGALDSSGTVNGAGSLIPTLTVTNSGSLNVPIADGAGFAAGIFKRTGGTTTVDAANTFTGTVKVEAGTLQLGTSGSFNSASSLVLGTGATMDLNNKSQSFSALNGAGGTVAMGSGTLTVNTTESNIYSGAITGAGGLVKRGAGSLELSGTSTYSGATSVQAGGLKVSGASNSSTFTVNGTGTLSGSGSVGGLIIGNGGTATPGNSPGTLSVAGNATWLAGGSYDWEATSVNTDSTNQTGAGTGWDYMDISGTLTLSGLSSGSRFNLNLLSLSDGINSGAIPDWDPAVGSTWLIATADGGILNGSSLVSTFSDYSSLFDIDTTGWVGGLPAAFQVVTLGSTTDLYLQALGGAAVPEPGQVAASILLLLGIGGYVFLKRRKASKAAAPAA